VRWFWLGGYGMVTRGVWAVMCRELEEVRSRISSIASGNGLGEAVRVGQGRKGSLGGSSQISPVDRNFLLGYLENVVKGGTGTGR